MHRLKIIVEETGLDAFEVVYVGRDAVKADAALNSPTANKRALFNYPMPTRFNRRLVAPAVAPGETNLAPVDPVQPNMETVPESGTEAAAETVDEAAALVGGETEAPAAAEAPKGRKSGKGRK